MPTYIRYNVAIDFRDKNNVPSKFQERVNELLTAAFYTEVDDGLMDINIRTEEEDDGDNDNEDSRIPPL